MKIFNIIITTKNKQIEYNAKTFIQGWDACKKVEDDSTWSAINPVIHSLEELRADTWNQDKITYIQEWLKDNFEVKDNYEQ